MSLSIEVECCLIDIEYVPIEIDSFSHRGRLKIELNAGRDRCVTQRCSPSRSIVSLFIYTASHRGRCAIGRGRLCPSSRPTVPLSRSMCMLVEIKSFPIEVDHVSIEVDVHSDRDQLCSHRGRLCPIRVRSMYCHVELAILVESRVACEGTRI